MSPPDAFTIDTALASLTGTITERKPETALDANLLRLRLVAEAKDAGIPWTSSAGPSECPGRKRSGGHEGAGKGNAAAAPDEQEVGCGP